MLSVIKAMAVNNLCYKAGQKMIPKGIVVHSTGANNPNLKRYVDAPNEVGKNQYGNHWNVAKPGGRSVCVHAFIGYDKNRQVRVAEILPLDICCWGVGEGVKGSYNYDPPYIQFEICEDGLNDKIYYREAFNVATEYCAELCRLFNIDVSNIVGHDEAFALGYGCNHADPEHWMKKHGESMADFRETVSRILKDKDADKKNEADLSEDSHALHNGDLVSIDEKAVYFSGKPIPQWVKEQNWYIGEEPTGERVVINTNEKGTCSICSPIHKRFLRLVHTESKTRTSGEQIDLADKCPYLVTGILDLLNIYSHTGIDAQIIRTISGRGVYTIVEEKQESGKPIWGRLKSHGGWVSLNSVRKI